VVKALAGGEFYRPPVHGCAQRPCRLTAYGFLATPFNQTYTSNVLGVSQARRDLRSEKDGLRLGGRLVVRPGADGAVDDQPDQDARLG
jgi:hypothetical protein